MKSLFFVILASISCSMASAESIQLTSEQKVISHPVVLSLETLLNAANDNKCETGTPQFFCMGALFDVTEPTIVNSGCAFTVDITCKNGAAATVSGNELNYFIQTPTTVGTVLDQGMNITDVALTPATAK